MRLLLTGSSSGIGRALAERLLTRGHSVWGLARSDQGDFAAQNPGFRAARGDVADWDALAETAAAVAAVWPHLDGPVTCAGLQGEIGPALACDPAKWSATIRTNLDGTYFAVRAFAALLRRAPRRGKIVCFSGGGATKPRPNFSAYGVAKTGVVRLVENIAAELAAEAAPIDINALAPGAIATRLTDEILALGPAIVGAAEFAAAQKTRTGASASDTSGDASLEKVLACVEWLLSSGSDGISGRLISAPWDPWPTLGSRAAELAATDLYTLRRIVPEDRGRTW